MLGRRGRLQCVLSASRRKAGEEEVGEVKRCKCSRRRGEVWWLAEADSGGELLSLRRDNPQARDGSTNLAPLPALKVILVD